MCQLFWSRIFFITKHYTMLTHTFCECSGRYKHGWKFSRSLILFTLGAYCMLQLCYDTVGLEGVSANYIQFMNCIASATLHFF
ncbi:unnamed protein product [Albugo candida]|uniref:Uncharacterized protein n=1 Tax=Albugo candida TaxID=65357 RepID=A0A024GBQ5_9STRA|nr:unnamed protein product [Albugo candida]|eukprot:CCI44099.1 unnamed protein product [Albugo candida]